MRAQSILAGLTFFALAGCNSILGLNDFTAAADGNGGDQPTSSGTQSAGGGGVGGAAPTSSSGAGGAGGDVNPTGTGGAGGSVPTPLTCALSEPAFTILSAAALGSEKLDKDRSNLSVFGTRQGRTYFGVSSTGKYFIQSVGVTAANPVSFPASSIAKFNGRVEGDALLLYGIGIGQDVSRISVSVYGGGLPTLPNPLVGAGGRVSFDVCHDFDSEFAAPAMSTFASTFVGDTVHYAVRTSCNQNGDMARVSIYKGEFPGAPSEIATRQEQIPIGSTNYLSWLPAPRSYAYFEDTGTSYIQLTVDFTFEDRLRFGKTVGELKAEHPFALTNDVDMTSQILGVASRTASGGLLLVAAARPLGSQSTTSTLWSGAVGSGNLADLANVPPASLQVARTLTTQEAINLAAFSEPAEMGGTIYFTGVSGLTERTVLLYAFKPTGEMRELGFESEPLEFALPINSLPQGARSMGKSVVTALDSKRLLVAWVGPETEAPNSPLVIRGQEVKCF